MIMCAIALLLLGLGFTVGALCAEDLEAALYDGGTAPLVVRIWLALGLPWTIVLTLIAVPEAILSVLQAHGSVILTGVRK